MQQIGLGPDFNLMGGLGSKRILAAGVLDTRAFRHEGRTVTGVQRPGLIGLEQQSARRQHLGRRDAVGGQWRCFPFRHVLLLAGVAQAQHRLPLFRERQQVRQVGCVRRGSGIAVVDRARRKAAERRRDAVERIVGVDVDRARTGSRQCARRRAVEELDAVEVGRVNAAAGSNQQPVTYGARHEGRRQVAVNEVVGALVVLLPRAALHDPFPRLRGCCGQQEYAGIIVADSVV